MDRSRRICFILWKSNDIASRYFYLRTILQQEYPPSVQLVITVNRNNQFGRNEARLFIRIRKNHSSVSISVTNECLRKLDKRKNCKIIKQLVRIICLHGEREEKINIVRKPADQQVDYDSENKRSMKLLMID